MKKTIKELDIYISDGNYSSKYPRSEEFVEEGIPFIRSNNMVDGDITDDEMYHITPEKHSILLKGHVKAGDVLITTRGNIGQVAIVPDRHEDSNINAQIVLLRTNQETLYNRYLLWALQSREAKEQYLALQTGTALKQLPVGKLEKLYIEATDINKQHEIADVFDKTYKVIKLRRKELQLLDDLIKARFVEMFGNPDVNENNWETYKMEQLCDVGSSKRIYQNEQSRIGIPFLRISDLVNRMDTGSKESDLYIPEDRFEELKKQGLVPKSGDILLTARGTLGRCYIIQDDDEFYFQDGMITWLSKYDAKITPLYISYLFEMPGFRKQIDSLQAGSTVAYLSISMTKKLNIMLPPIELQNQFADFVKQVNKSKVAIQAALDKSQLLFDSLMQKYFG